ncbi:hypothetical protein KR026_004687 [Drosophila bipectinata]|nr:hypothetical protein KR026_004687 [Drosophila bipectinata]
MLTKVELPCFIDPVPVRHHQSYIFLRVRGNNIPYHLTNQHGNEFYISRRKLQKWFRKNIAAVIPLLQNIPCGGGRRYRLKYIPNGHVAHTIKATLLTNPCHFIDFDFVPAFAFSPREWPREFPRHRNGEQAWYAVPRKFKSPLAEDDPLSFNVAAPHWERMVLHKKQNLKDGYRLLKAVRDANDLPLLFSYTIKSVFLNDAKKNINWNQSPGKILIRAIVQTTNHLNRGFLPFFLVPKSNVLDHLQKKDIYNYKAKLFRVLKRLIKCRDRDSMSPEDIKFIFGIEM